MMAHGLKPSSAFLGKDFALKDCRGRNCCGIALNLACWARTNAMKPLATYLRRSYVAVRPPFAREGITTELSRDSV